jgi:inositol oxygenase
MRLEAWDDYVAQRYKPGKAADDFRSYADAPPAVKELYRQNHEGQTLAFVRSRHAAYVPARRENTSMWEALERLNELVDDSDPDTDLPQIAHALQTAEKARADNQPDWLQLVGLIHDAGKMLCFWGEPQWAVVGDTFPVGCRFSDKIVYPKYFAANPDAADPLLSSEMGIYEPGCGLDNTLMAWGHDEYIFQTLRDSKLPAPALAMLRYHSFYPWHREGAYGRLMDESDREKLFWVREFNQYDLYSKSDAAPDIVALRPHYQRLIEKYLPATIQW